MALPMTTTPVTGIGQEVLDSVAGYDDELKKVGIGALAVGAVVLIFKRGWRFFKGLSS